jgi:hypothetical protein
VRDGVKVWTTPFARPVTRQLVVTDVLQRRPPGERVTV